jgi:hypothetical protein
MNSAIKMNYKTKEDVISSLLKKYLKKEDNLLLSHKLFIAKSVINWVFENTKNSSLIKLHIDDVEKYIVGEIDFFWKDGIIIKKKIKK